jgi:hypothetical protein
MVRILENMQIGAQRAATRYEKSKANKFGCRNRGATMAEKKKQVKPAAKKDPKKTLKGAKKLGETKLMIVI